MTRVRADRPRGSGEGATVRTRRELFRAVGAAFPIAAGVAFTGSAYGFSGEEMPDALAKLYRDRCTADPLHAPTLDAALARLDAAGIKYDRNELAASLRCPVCGCSIISAPEALDRAHKAPPSF